MRKFFMAMIPPTVTAQEHKVTVRNGKPVFYDTAEIKQAKAKLMAYLSKHKPDRPYREGVRLVVMWLFPRGKHRDGEYRITKPDTDNLQKLLKDCMTACGFWKDDSLVASEHVEKFWADMPGIYISVEELNQKNRICRTCRWYAEAEGVCCNGGSANRADFVEDDYACERWEGKVNA